MQPQAEQSATLPSVKPTQSSQKPRRQDAPAKHWKWDLKSADGESLTDFLKRHPGEQFVLKIGDREFRRKIA